MSKRIILIQEKSSKLDSRVSKDEYILEGTFTQFGVLNSNNRIYEEKEFLPHLEYLQEQARENTLLGELDHPEKFDVTLANVSHVIENLEYDKKSRQIVGRIRLLNTKNGEQAKSLVDSGIPISISSRAAGLVRENKTVELKRVFTYDLVATPGFKNARLNRINESLGFDDNSSMINVYDVSESEKFVRDYNQLVEGFKVDSKSTFYSNYDSSKYNSTDKMGKDTYVSESQLKSYSKKLAENLERNFVELNQRINTMKGKSSDGRLREELADVKKIQESLIRFLEHKVVPHLNALTNYTEYATKLADNSMAIAESAKQSAKKNARKFDKVEDYLNYVSENLNYAINYTETISKHGKANHEYVKHISEKLNESINYMDMLGQKLNENINYTERVASSVNEGINYTERVAGTVNALANYTEDVIAENLNASINYQNAVAQKVNENINYTERVARSLNDNINYTEHVAEHTNNAINFANETVRRINESNGFSDEVGNKYKYKSISDKIDDILGSVRNQKTEQVVNENNFMQYRFINDNLKRDFLKLSSTQKQKVLQAINESRASTETEIVSAWRKALYDHNATADRFIVDMPNEYRGIWESLAPADRQAIVAQSKFYNLTTEGQIRHFWQTRTIGDKRLAELSPLNETSHSYGSLNESLNVGLGYSNDSVSNAKAAILKKFNNF